MAHIARSRMQVAFSVADGVGGWEDQGVNPAAFSHGLCRYMAEATLRPETDQDLRPIHLLSKAYDQVQSDKKIPAGGSTATVAMADASGYLEAANLGDSGFVVLSPGKVSYKSEPQTSNFNTPFQMSKLTPEMQRQQKIFGGAVTIQDTPSRSDISHTDLSHGDVIVFGTDGLWDNLSAMEVLQIISVQMEKAGHWIQGSRSVNDSKLKDLLFPARNPSEDLAGQMAYAVMREAKVASLDTRRDGPFAKEVHRWFPGEDYHGGKVDDIAVIVCIAIQDAGGKVKAKL
ncbi:putative stage II sporulation protein E [Elsinoe fawcettii]|nr:putative stage II sporulation protein E [Elsinoe fawcettii]